ncbi:MAG: excinuclease ABC subunit UvrA [Pyrinomonadaceae bacterium]|nr:excinuclease ABC subunit UvrA [Pyrinomonadaceae bacterium]MCX7639099.1 excinuclease ABC subunit UvrA [Pyrinomonadaceae bacterium]MDW8303680.1 excinuclease ABC subunit UvrA [Acidobacteriota bacterium]
MQVKQEEAIEVRGARVHNLKNVSCSIPINKLTVITGVSGSGKSSLAFDTIYAEGQRRYVESLSAYARQFLERMDKPDVDEIIGIAPAIAIRQKNSTRNPRSTVATQTEIYDYLRLLYARVGQTFCRVCGREIKKDSPQSAAEEIIQTLKEETRFYVLFPVKTDGKKPKKQALLLSLMQQGFSRLFREGQIIELRQLEDYPYEDFSNTFILIDRLKASPSIKQRLIDSLEICFRESNEALIITTDGFQMKFSTEFVCKYDGTAYQEPEPALFSFNSPFGACPTCQGFGNITGIDFDLVIPNQLLSLEEGAIEPFSKPNQEWAQKELLKFAKKAGISTSVPFHTLTEEQKKMIWHGVDGWRGVLGFFRWLESKKYKLHVRVFLSKYRGYTICPDCLGGRLRREACDVKIAGKSLPEVVRLSISEAKRFFDELKLPPEREKIAERLLLEIKRRLKFLCDVGLDYLTLDRLASTLSGGEAQRIQLATNLGSSLVGALYVLDEPSIGLHPRDNLRLIKILQNLRDIGNTVLVVEHDEDMIRAADKILDLGPLAGEQGGQIVFEGTFDELMKDENSLTAKYLRGDTRIKTPSQRRKPTKRKIKIIGARENNLKNITVEIPLDIFVCVTGVSGSGKSTLVYDVLYAGLKKQKGEWQGKVGLFKEIQGSELIDDIVLVDQSPIGKTPRSNPATYLKIYDAIRELFASTMTARAKNYDASYFSFNIPGGRCETCQGSGTVTIEMQFLADVEITCEECHGTRFKNEILDVRYKGKNIHEVLQMTVREAIAFFKEIPKIVNRLKVLDAIGLGYLRLGQSATTLSGGEAQRIKLAAHLLQKNNSRILYIFDEPTTGLHFEDVKKLLSAFRVLIEEGASLLVIEHNLEVIKTADYVIDLGPEGGSGGGYIVATGTPEEIAANQNSHTGRYLKKVLS